MRTYRFRAWDKKRKLMYYIPSAFGLNIDKSHVGIYDNDTGRFICYDSILMQYTGLKDKKGKEIYCDDYVKGYQTPTKGIVYWAEEIASFRVRPLRQSKTQEHYPLIGGNWYEVIGNIYENKELLK